MAQLDMTIDGQGARAARNLSVTNPATLAQAGTAPDGGQAELDAAVEAARRAFAGWAATPLADRQQAVARMAQVIRDNAAELTALEVAEGGRPAAISAMITGLAAHYVQTISGFDIRAEVIDPTAARRIEARRAPIGVAGAIVPWNFPLLIASWKIASAVLAGCALVVKPSPLAPLAVLRLGQLLRGVFPDGVVNVISGGDRLGPLMTAHPGIDKIAFTGSTATGRRVMESAAPTLKGLTLELGGNDAAIVFADADLEAVAQQVFWSAVANSGQACIASKRIYVQRPAYDGFVAAMRAMADAMPMGDPNAEGVMLGPLQNRAQYDRVNSLIQGARAQGLDIHQGPRPDLPGLFVPVTVIANPPQDSEVVRAEQFGPILPVIPFDSEDEAVALANDSDMGLTATIWTADMDRAGRLADRLDVGSVWINEAQALSPLVPFGGWKQSGIGVEGGAEGILAYTRIKSVTVRKPEAA